MMGCGHHHILLCQLTKVTSGDMVDHAWAILYLTLYNWCYVMRCSMSPSSTMWQAMWEHLCSCSVLRLLASMTDALRWLGARFPFSDRSKKQSFPKYSHSQASAITAKSNNTASNDTKVVCAQPFARKGLPQNAGPNGYQPQSIDSHAEQLPPSEEQMSKTII